LYTCSMADEEKIRILQDLIDSHAHITGFTGAGLSTESGIPDFRSKGGIWERYVPIYFDEFLRDPLKQLEYWKRKLEMWPQFRDAQPNSGHFFLKELQEKGRLAGVITQNVDGMHAKSGLPEEKIVRLHGTNSEVVCLSCGKIHPARDIMEGLDLDRDGPPRCSCGGILKPNTISFGQNLRATDLQRAEELSLSCDLMIVLGSTLVVYPAAGFPEIAKQNGADLAIITLSDTPLDDLADVVLHAPIGEVVSRIEIRKKEE